MRILILIFALFGFYNANSQALPKVVIELDADSARLGDSLELKYRPVFSIDGAPMRSITHQKEDRKWTICLDSIAYISIKSSTIFDMKSFILAEPGDSIVIKLDGSGRLSFSGRGASKANLVRKLNLMKHVIPLPANPVTYSTRTLDDYLQWSAYLDNQCNTLLAVIDSNKNEVSGLACQLIKSNIITDIEKQRHMKFRGLYVLYSDTRSSSGMKSNELCDIYDSTCFKDPARWARSLPFSSIVDPAFIAHQIFRGMRFPDAETYSKQVRTNIDGYTLMYRQGQKEYIGDALESFSLECMTKVIRKVGFIPEAEALLTSYYNSKANKVYKDILTHLEEKERVLKPGSVAPNFLFANANGDKISKSSLRNKIALINFIDDSAASQSVVESINNVKSAFEKDTNVVFINAIAQNFYIDWRAISASYHDKSEANLFFYKVADRPVLLRDYNVTSYPTLCLIDGQGKVIENSLKKLIDGNGDHLLSLVKRESVLLRDGPYILHRKRRLDIFSFDGNSILKQTIKRKSYCKMEVGTDEYQRNFHVVLKKKMLNEKCTFEKPGKIFVVSDIEGDFAAFRELLQANKIIDADYNWIYGTGHLVCNGDFLDRGKQVTEVLWLIYSLEDKAKKCGGYVHYILGNHEVMNLNGDFRYVNQKYKDNAEKIETYPTEIYGVESELGKWLRTKNIVEKIGNILFVHGGISKEIGDLHLTVERINEIARPFYSRDSIARTSCDRYLSLIFDYNLSPLWCRQYYMKEDKKISVGSNGIDTVYKPTERIIDSILSNFGVKHIVTGHTIINEGGAITSHYDGKIINTDTRHASGLSEALLIEENSLYRVDKEGKRNSLWSLSSDLTKNE